MFLRQISRHSQLSRNFASQVENKFTISSNFVNRNPRNLERLRIAYKPDGYHLEKPGKCFWHKVQLSASNRYATASVVHFENGEVLKVSTSEWALRKHLYSPLDITAFYNLGRVMADRCLKSGLFELHCNIIPPNPNGRTAHFLRALQEGGINLKEPSQFKAPRPWDLHREEKPWEITE